MRLNQFISLHSKFSRRESDKLILEGKVRVNHSIATQHTAVPQNVLDNPKKAYKDFRIFIHGKEIKYYKDYTSTMIVYHKPKGELVSKTDSLNRPLIYQSLGAKYAHFIPVGRLDFASEGLLILGDNKEIVRQLMESNLTRVYLVKIQSFVTQKMQEAMQDGLELSNAKAGGHSLSKITAMQFAPMQFEIIKNSHISKLKIFLQEGKNRELRRFFAHFNAQVLDLKRVSYGFVNLNALPVGKVRFFNKQEYEDLRKFLKQDSKQSKKHKTYRLSNNQSSTQGK